MVVPSDNRPNVWIVFGLDPRIRRETLFMGAVRE